MYLQLAEGDPYLAADNCGLKPIKPGLGIFGNEAKARQRNPAKWAEYDRKLAAWVKCREDKGKSTGGALLNVTLAPGRALFNLMTEMNIDGIATKLARRPWAEVAAQWNKVGGKPSTLAKMINKGKGKKPKKIGFLNKFKTGGSLAEDNPFLSAYQPSYYLSEVTPEKKAAIIAAATAAGTAIGTVVPGAGNAAGAAAGGSMGAVIALIVPLIAALANDTAGEDPNNFPPPTPTIPEDESLDTPTDTTTTDAKKYIVPIAIGAAGLGLIYFMTRKK